MSFEMKKKFKIKEIFRKIFDKINSELMRFQYQSKLLKTINTFMIIIAAMSTTFFRLGSREFYTTLIFFSTMFLLRIFYRFLSDRLYAFLFLYGSSITIIGVTFYSQATPNLTYIVFILITAGVITNWLYTTILFVFDGFLIFLMTVFGDYVFFDLAPDADPFLQIFPLVPFIIMGYAFSLVISRELKEYLIKITTSESKLQITLAGITDGVITLNAKNEITYLNKSALTLLNLEKTDFVGKKFDESISIHNSETKIKIDVENLIQDCKSPLYSWKDDMEIKSLDGKTYLIQYRITPLVGDTQNPDQFLFVFRDITMEKEIEAAFIRNQKIESIAVLAGGIAHDFNNILGGIQGQVSLLEYDMKESITTEMKDIFDGVNQGIQKATALTHQLLTFAKGGAPRKESSNICELVRESAEFALHGTGVALDHVIDPNIWTVSIDRAQISQVIQNLVLNTVQANPKDMKTHIYYENEFIEENYMDLPPGNYVKIDFLDYGHGISQENLDKIFDPYFTTKSSGTGLGLAVSYSIISQHDGIIYVNSAVGEYSKFSIYLPAFPETQVNEKNAPVMKNEKSYQNFQVRALVLEDDPLLHRSISKMLDRLGCECLIFNDGEALIEAYRKNEELGRNFDFVLLDLTVPGGMGGLETLKNLKLIDKNICAIASSGYSTSNVATNHSKYGFSAFLNKPYTLAELASSIEKAIY